MIDRGFSEKKNSEWLGHYGLRLRRNLAPVSDVCETAPRSLFWASNGLNELPEVRFEFPFNLIGKLAMVFFSNNNNNNNNNNNSNKEQEKIEKYLDFKKELKRLWNCKEVVLVSIVIGALGTVSKRFHLYLTKAGLDGSILPLQKAYLLGTAKDCKSGYKEV